MANITKGSIKVTMSDGQEQIFTSVGVNAGLSPEEVVMKTDVDSELSDVSENPVQNKIIDGVLDDKADLVDGRVPSDQLPSYVDDVVEYASVNDFPQEGEVGKIYLALDTNLVYRWSGSEYIQIAGATSVLDFNSISAFPATGEEAIIYIADDTNKQYRWDGSNYVELSVEDYVELVSFQTETALTASQIRKAKEGKLIVYHATYSCTCWPSRIYNNRVFFIGHSIKAVDGVNVQKDATCTTIEINLDTTTGLLSNVISVTSNNVLKDDSDNFFDASTAPTANGKKLVREMNVAGKLIPSYAAADAGKVVKVNSSGTGVELADEEGMYVITNCPDESTVTVQLTTEDVDKIVAKPENVLFKHIRANYVTVYYFIQKTLNSLYGDEYRYMNDYTSGNYVRRRFITVNASTRYARFYDDSIDLNNTYQAKLVSGSNIKTINNTSILGSGNIDTSYTAGTGIDITSGTISVDSSTVAMKSDLPTGTEEINFNDTTTTATDTTLNNIVVGNSTDGYTRYVAGGGTDLGYPAYDATATYRVGDIVIYDNKIYQCITTISTAEAWTAAHWNQIAVDIDNIAIIEQAELGHVLSDAKAAQVIKAKALFIHDAYGLRFATFYDESNGRRRFMGSRSIDSSGIIFQVCYLYVYSTKMFGTDSNVQNVNFVRQIGGAKGYVSVDSSLQASSTSSGGKLSLTGNLPYLDTAPTADNTSGFLKIVVLSAEPATRYNGYLYIITAAAQ